MLMFVATLATVFVTSIGTFLIWRQVALTRRAVEDTGEATEAMREANVIARQSMQKQLRAYVSIGKPTLTHTKGNRWTARFPIKNTGQTPATSRPNHSYMSEGDKYRFFSLSSRLPLVHFRTMALQM
jgi:hypothetical protein